MGNSLPAFVDTVPDYAVKDGRMEIRMGDLALIMPLAVFLDGCERGKSAIVDWQREKCGIDHKVLQFPRR